MDQTNKRGWRKAGVGIAGMMLLGLVFGPLWVGCGAGCPLPTGKWKVAMTPKGGSCPTPPAQVIDFGEDSNDEAGNDNCKIKIDKAACSLSLDCQESGEQELAVTGQLKMESKTQGSGSANLKIVSADGNELSCEFTLTMTKQ